MFSLFKRHKKIDFSALGVDIHSHLIPGIDDGAKSMEESLHLIQGLVDLGFKEIITTPHIMGEYYENTPEIILSGLANVNAALKEKNIDVRLRAAAEYHLDDYFEQLLQSNSPFLTLPGNHILIELSTFAPPQNFYNTLFQLNTKGYKPILAHPERYVYYYDKFGTFQQIKSKGCLFQLNLLSLTGHYGSLQKKLAMKLLKAGLVDFVATDTHHKGHIEKLSQALSKKVMRDLLSKYTFRNREFSSVKN